MVHVTCACNSRTDAFSNWFDYFYVVLPVVDPNLDTIAGYYGLCGFHGRTAQFDVPGFTRVRRLGAGFGKPDGPNPCVDTNATHELPSVAA